VDWLGPALVLYVMVAAVVVARRRLAKMESLRVAEVGTLARLIRSGSREELEAHRNSRPPESLESVLLAVFLSDDSSAARIATVNEHLGDLDRELDASGDVARRIGRGALLSGTLACVLGLTLTVTGPSGPAWGPSATSFVLGLIGWAVAMELDRRTRRAADLARAEWDRVAVAFGDRLSGGSPNVTTEGPEPEMGG
jgi:hypothetical protein